MGAQNDLGGLFRLFGMTMADLAAASRFDRVHGAQRLLMSPLRCANLSDRAPALLSLFWERYGILPRHLLLVEVTHPKAPYVLDNRYQVTVFDRDPQRGGVIGVELRFGFMEEPNVERQLEDLASHRQIDLPSDPAQWSCM